MSRSLIYSCVAALLLTFPAVLRAQTGAVSTHVFPLFVDGPANGIVYRSSVKIIPVNAAKATIQCRLTQRGIAATFVGLYGDRYFADVFSADERPAAATAITLDRYLPWEVLRTTAANSLTTGYATVACSEVVNTQLHISLSNSAGTKLGETTLPPALQGTSFEFLLDRRDNTRLGFALINDSPIEGEYIVIARDEFNQEVDRRYDTLGAWDHVSRFVDETLRLPVNFVGTIEVVGVSGGRSYVTGLQFTGPVFAAVSPIVRDTPLSF